MAASTGNENAIDRVLRLLIVIGKMVLDGTRNAYQLCQVLQIVKSEADWYSQLFANAIPTQEDARRQLEEWQRLYTEVFELKDVDFSRLRIPTSRPGFTRMLVICSELKPSQIFKALNDRMLTTTSCRDLNTIKSIVTRPNARFYVIWVKDRVEADEEFRGLSADQLQEQGINCLNLQERLLYELKYFLETNQHMDIKNVNLCAGSRDDNDRASWVQWSRGSFNVGLVDRSGASDSLRTRQVIS